MRRPVPVTLLTGFLGAGKTTLLNHLIRTGSGRRFAVVENEFGDLGMDGSLLSAPVDALLELNDGCVCCTVRDDLLAALEQLADRSGDFDHVIIETTGLADPAPVMRLFDHPQLRDTFTLDGVVTVVDACNIERSLAEVETCAEQIVTADLLILSKIDRQSSQALDTTEARLRQLNPLATILRAEHGQVALEAVLELGGRPAEASLPSHHSHAHHDHQHDDEIRSVAVEADGDVDVEALDLWLGRLTRSRELSLLRMKGILAVSGHPQRFVFHGVRDVVDVRPERPWGSEPRRSRAVFIGRGLDPEDLQAGFAACRLVPPEASATTDSAAPRR